MKMTKKQLVKLIKEYKVITNDDDLNASLIKSLDEYCTKVPGGYGDEMAIKFIKILDKNGLYVDFQK